jgi:hypothetical protein
MLGINRKNWKWLLLLAYPLTLLGRMLARPSRKRHK